MTDAEIPRPDAAGSPPAAGPPVHVRTIRVEAVESGDHELLVRASLVDERPQGGPRWWGTEAPEIIHHMTVALRVRYPELTITSVDGEMASHPYTICPDALPPLQQLVGVSVIQGFTRAVNERLGRERGCAHMTALIHAMGPVVKQAAGAAFGEPEDPQSDGGELWFVNTCQAWRENGPLHRLIQAGDERGMQAMSAYRKRDAKAG